MTLVKWRPRTDLSPWAPIRDLEDGLNRFLGEVGKDVGIGERDWTPALDVRETDSEYVIEADIPGMDKDDIHLEVIEDTLTVKGERKQVEETDKENYHRVERRYGSFYRTVQIPGGFDAEKIKADFKNGVLSVHLPKPEETKAKRIEVAGK